MKSKPFLHSLCAALLLCAATSPLPAAVPATTSYQGRVAVSGTPFTGAGLFRFALINQTDGSTLWSNDGTSLAGSEPTDGVTLVVTDGLFDVRLGDVLLVNMGALPADLFASYPDVALRVWFDDGVNGSFQLTPDTTLASVPYALAAEIPAGSLTGDKLAPGSVDATRLAISGAPTPGQVVTYDGAGLAWVDPTTGGGGTLGWLLGGNLGTASGNFLGTIDAQNVEFRANNNFAFRIRASDQNLIFARVPSIGFSFLSGDNGLGIYGTSAGFGGTIGRTFGGVNVGGPVLYGESGGGLGVTYRAGGTPPFYFDATLVEKPILMWENAAGQGATIHIGGYGANGDPKLIKFGDADYVHIGENGSDDTLELKASRFNFVGGSINKLDVADNFEARVGAADFLLGHSSRRGTPGRALVDFGNALVVNFNGDWSRTIIGGSTVEVRTLTITGGADLAEPFPLKEVNLDKGSVVVIDEEHTGQLKLATTAYDTRVAGIISGANGISPGIALHQQGRLEGTDNVALTGRVYVKADASFGAIKPGDLLTTSDTPGHAMKVTNHGRSQGAILGKAMSSLKDGTGLVLVLVTLQ